MFEAALFYLQQLPPSAQLTLFVTATLYAGWQLRKLYKTIRED